MLKKLLGIKKEQPPVWRQGDVFVVPVSAMPDGVKPSRPVLAEGEVTGHSHRIADPSTAQLFSGRAGMYLQVTSENTTVIHDEHKPITVPRGLYTVRIQREYHPKEIRRVVD